MTTMTQVITRTADVTQPWAPPPPSRGGIPLVLLTRPPVSSGSRLGGEPQVIMVPQPLSAAREGHVQSRLETLLTQGRELKIRTLLHRINGFEGATEWMAEFTTIDSEQTEQRALSLARLVIQVIQPQHLFALETLTYEILQTMLPAGESVSSFVEKCEVGLQKHKLYLEQCQREHAVARDYIGALRSTAQRTNAQIEQECASLREQMQAVQAERNQMTAEARADLDALEQRINQLQNLTVIQATEIGEQDLGEQQFYEVLMECTTILEKLI